MPDTCPVCAEPASGRFCSHCGTDLEAPAVGCSSCGNAEIPAGARFCNRCGAPAGVEPVAAVSPAAPAPTAEEPRSANLPWVITGVALAALIGVLLWPRLRGPEEPAAPPFASGTAAGAAGMGDPRSIDLSSMTPREAADRLFNRVMENVSVGDSAQAKRFLPMALAAYGQVPDMNLDGRYHIAVLQLVNDDPAAARAQADSILSADPNHLFGIFTAAQAEEALGNEQEALELYERFLDVRETEEKRVLREYVEHAAVLPAMREEAERVVAGSD